MSETYKRFSCQSEDELESTYCFDSAPEPMESIIGQDPGDEDDTHRKLSKLKAARRELEEQLRYARAEKRRREREEEKIKNERILAQGKSEILALVEALKDQASRPIVVNAPITMPEIKIPPQPPMPEIKIPATIVHVEKPDPVIVNLPPNEQKSFDVQPVRDEDGKVVMFRRIPKE